jgi:hypothetical protein
MHMVRQKVEPQLIKGNDELPTVMLDETELAQ